MKSEETAPKNGLIMQTDISSDSISHEKLPGPEGNVPARKKYTMTQWLTLLTLAFGNFSIGACISIHSPFFPKEAESKGATPTEYGLIFGIYQLTIFLMAPIMGKLISYLEPKFVLNTGMLVIGVTSMLFGFLDYSNGRVVFVSLAFIVRIVEGVGAAAGKTAYYTIIASQFTDNMATTFGFLETFFGVGLIIGPTIGGILYDIGGYGLPFYVMGVIVLIDAVVIYFVLKNPERRENVRKGNLLKFWLSPGIIVYTLVVFTTFNYVGYNLSTLEPHIRQFDLSGIFLGMMFALAGTFYACSAPVWGWLIDKKCSVKLLCIIGCFIMIASLLLIGPMPFLGLKPRTEIAISALIIMGIGMGAKLVCAFSGSLQDTISRGFPSDITTYGLVSSMIASFQSLGAFAGPSLGGYLLDTVGYEYGTLVLLALEILVVAVLIIYSLTNVVMSKMSLRNKGKGEKNVILYENGHTTTYSSYENFMSKVRRIMENLIGKLSLM